MIRRRFPRHWSRPLLLALLVLGLVGAPVLAAIGNTHDLFHGGDTAAHAHTTAHDDADDDDAGLLHAAMHCATCGAHTPALPALLSLLAPIPKARHAGLVIDAGAARMPDTLFRPPISA